MQKILGALIFSAMMLVSSLANADIAIASFNTKHWGWNNDKDTQKMAEIFNRFDLIAVQEVMDDAVVANMAKILTRQTGDAWQSMSSHAIGRGSYKEHYAFLWRTPAVEYVDGAVVYLDNGDVFAREPYSARFRDTDMNLTFAMSAVHVLYGDSISDRVPEIKALARYWQWMEEIYPDTPIILGGDFNLPPSNSAWRSMNSEAQAMIQVGATTLSPVNGRFASLYDNLWVTPNALPIHQYGIFNYPSVLQVTHEYGRDHISDHTPVFITLGERSIDLGLKPLLPGPPNAGKLPAIAQVDANAQVPTTCVDLNSSSPQSLEALPAVGSSRAKAIIDGRPWDSADRLSAISGIGPATVAEIKSSGLLCST